MIKRKLVHGIISLSVGVLLTLFLVFEESLSVAARDAMHVSALHVIPTLFPYAVISSVIVSLGLLDPICRFIPMRRLFHLPPESAAVALTGMLGGFPTGALGACKLCERGVISREDAARLSALSSCASPAFIIGTVGSLWGREYAVFILIFQTLSAVVIAAILARGATDGIPIPTTSEVSRPSPIRALCSSISDSATACVVICGYIVFFRVVATLIGKLVPPLFDYAATLLEFSSGAIAGAARGGIAGISLTGFAVGFSGVSVLMQTANITSPRAIPFSPIFITKLAQGAVLSLASAVFYLIRTPESTTVSACTNMHEESTPTVLAIILFAAAALIFAVHKKYFSRRY